MCGIAGILRVHPPGTPAPPPRAAIPESWLDILDESIKHRGPDGHGRFRDRATRPDGTIVDVALVHRRLAIIDIADGAQPMVSRDGGIAVVFNGCIYNHRELRNELQAAGHEFQTDHSDTEVLIHGWRKWGYDLAGRLDGMFAFIVWDRTLGELHVARDRFGEKPLYYRDHCNSVFTLAISGTIPGLARLPLGLDARHAQPFVARNFRNSLTRWVRYGYDNIPPVLGLGQIDHANICSAGRGQQTGRGARMWAPGQSWWSTYHRPPRTRDQKPSVEEIDRLIGCAVSERLEADVPLGCFLSGGVDSSLVAVHAHLIRPEVEAFTVRMPDPRMDESPIATEVARRIGIRHTVLNCHPRPAEDLVRLIRQLGLPFGDSSLLPTYWVCKEAAAHVKVALSGDGGDELFGGYRRYKGAHLLGHMGLFRFLLRATEPFFPPNDQPHSIATTRARFIRAAARDGYADLLSIFPRPLIDRVGLRETMAWPIRAAVYGILGLVEATTPITEWRTHLRIIGAISSDIGRYLPEDILRKTDTASMAVPLEVRSPFLSTQLSTLALRTRIPTLMPHGQRKGLLRAVARKYLPSEIIDRPKQGFAIPIGEWFRSDYGGMKQLLLDHLNSTEPFGPPSLGINLNMAFIRQMLDEHMGTGMSGRIKRDHSQRLYMLLVLSIWAKWVGSLR